MQIPFHEKRFHREETHHTQSLPLLRNVAPALRTIFDPQLVSVSRQECYDRLGRYERSQAWRLLAIRLPLHVVPEGNIRSTARELAMNAWIRKPPAILLHRSPVEFPIDEDRKLDRDLACLD